MVSALDSGASTWCRALAGTYCVVFMGKTLYSRDASLNPVVEMGTGEQQSRMNTKLRLRCLER